MILFEIFSGHLKLRIKIPPVSTASCNSFSKDLMPDLRMGWLLAGKYREKVKRLKFNNSMADSQLMQRAVAIFLEGGG
ncbi:MAG: hypothetical protein KAR01_08395 [Desulfocapsa sp.]|nr:hypothetical protein [Desulfocapsa sp.]